MGYALCIDEVVDNFDGTVELRGVKMSAKSAHRKMRLGVQIMREEEQFNMLFGRDVGSSDARAAQVAAEVYDRMVVPLKISRDCITGQRHSVTVPDTEYGYKSGMIYPLNGQ